MLYFIPTTHTPTLEDMQNAGLSYAFDPAAGVISAATIGGTGPENKQGVVVCRQGRSPSFNPAKMNWFKHDDAGWQSDETVNTFDDIYFGWEQPPGPDMLAKSHQLKGHAVQLRDGKQWQIPVALRWSEPNAYSSALPRAAKRDDDGRWVPGDVVKDYRRLWEIAIKWMSGEKVLISEAIGLVCEILQVNYHMGPEEFEKLELVSWGHEEYDPIFAALIDQPGRDEIKKKRASDTMNTARGGRDYSPTTNQLLPT